MNLLEVDQDRAITELCDAILVAGIAGFCGDLLDEGRLLRGAKDALDTATYLDESATALQDASAVLASTDHQPPTLGALEFRRDLARGLKSSAATGDEAAGLLRCLADDLVRVVQRQRDARAKARRDEELREFGRRLQQKMREEEETPERLAQRFSEMYSTQMMGEPSIADRIAQRRDEAERDAIAHGRTLSE